MQFSDALIYDVECYPSYFLVGFYSIRADKFKFFEYSLDLGLDDRLLLEKTIKGRTLIGFNNFNYDDIMLTYVIRNPFATPQELYEVSTNIVRDEFYARQNKLYSMFRNNYDLMELHRKGYNRPSLKMAGVKLKHPTLAEAPIPFDRETLTIDEIALIKKYNQNDLEITKIILDRSQSALSIREMLYKQYGIEKLKSASESGATKLILDKLFIEQQKRKDLEFDLYQFKKTLPQKSTDVLLGSIIYDSIHYDNSQLQNFLETLKSTTVSFDGSDTEFKKNSVIEFDGKVYNILRGGIHSQDDAGIFQSDENTLILDLDITSMYPSAILNNRIIPEGIPEETLTILETIVKQRVASKDIANQLKKQNKQNTSEYILHKGIADSFKIVINTWYGVMGDPTYWLYDPASVLKVTINNQLQMLMLIEKLYNIDIHTISANTDGITLVFPKGCLEDVRSVYRQWESETKFRLEECFYKTVVRRDINNYLAVYDDGGKGQTKEKGVFVYDPHDLLKSAKFPIIPIALKAYYVNGIPPEETILNHRDIYDFCFTEKSDKSFQSNLYKISRKLTTHSPKTGKIYKKPIYEELSEELMENLGRIYRVFVSLPIFIKTDENGSQTEVGYVIKKCKADKKDNVAGLKDCFITLFNDYFGVSDFSEYRINHQYYIDRVHEEIAKIAYLEKTYDYTKVPLFCNGVYKRQLAQKINELRTSKSLEVVQLKELSAMISVYSKIVNLPLSL